MISMFELLLRKSLEGISSGIWKKKSGSAYLFVNKLNPQHIDSRIQAAQVSGQIELEGNIQAQFCAHQS